jgi:hypothetical protein
MTLLLALWLPILLSAVAVFVVSSVIHMALPWHKNDYPPVPNEAQVMDALRPLAIPRGDYMMPRPATREELRSPAFLERMNKGPVMILTVLPNGPTQMGPTFVRWFLYLVFVAIFAGYVARWSLPPGADFWRVFRTTAVVAFVGYALALWQMSIWYRRAWSTTLKATVDGFIYALVTAGILAWLWPR